MIYKFRTMIQDAEKDGHARLASEKDDRILPVGRFLRATRLDELAAVNQYFEGRDVRGRAAAGEAGAGGGD